MDLAATCGVDPTLLATQRGRLQLYELLTKELESVGREIETLSASLAHQMSTNDSKRPTSVPKPEQNHGSSWTESATHAIGNWPPTQSTPFENPDPHSSLRKTEFARNPVDTLDDGRGAYQPYDHQSTELERKRSENLLQTTFYKSGMEQQLLSDIRAPRDPQIQLSEAARVPEVGPAEKHSPPGFTTVQSVQGFSTEQPTSRLHRANEAAQLRRTQGTQPAGGYPRWDTMSMKAMGGVGPDDPHDYSARNKPARDPCPEEQRMSTDGVLHLRHSQNESSITAPILREDSFGPAMIATQPSVRIKPHSPGTGPPPASSEPIRSQCPKTSDIGRSTVTPANLYREIPSTAADVPRRELQRHYEGSVPLAPPVVTARPENFPTIAPGNLSTMNKPERTKERPLMKPDRYDGKTSWTAYNKHFELCAELNGWNERDKLQYLAVLLTGPAQQILGSLPKETTEDYIRLVKALQARFDPTGRLELHRAQLRNRRQKTSESLVELAEDIRRLVDKVYVDLSADSRDRMARDHFLDALSDGEIRIRVIQMRTATLDDAVAGAVELEALQKAEKARMSDLKRVRSASVQQSSTDEATETSRATALTAGLQQQLKEMSEQLHKLQKQVKAGRGRRTDKEPRCYHCKELGHIKPKCPLLTKKEESAVTEKAHQPTKTNQGNC